MEIPQKTITQADVEEWYRLQDELRKVKTKEMLLRKKIFEAVFPEPKEGTNSVELGDGYVLKGKHVINRTIDEGSLQAMSKELQEAGINTDELIEWKPSLKTREYRKLTAEQIHLFDQVLIVKDGSPGLEIVQAKR